MAKLRAKTDKLSIDSRGLNFRKLSKSIETAMNDVMADHGRKYDRGRAPDGSAQKRNSPDYARRKRTEGIKVGGQRFRGSVPTILTGRTKNARQVTRRGNSVEADYGGRGEIAAYLDRRGYKLHFLSAENIEVIEESVAERASELLRTAIRVERD